MAAALNLTPIFEVLGYLIAIGIGLFILFWIGFFILMAISSVFDFLGGNRDNEFGGIIVFYGGLAIVIFLIVMAFTNDLVAFK